MVGISLYSYLYPKVAKMICLIISYVFSSTKLKKRVEHVNVKMIKGEKKKKVSKS
jgi:hypothetical protein